jgi:hypothetical protein
MPRKPRTIVTRIGRTVEALAFDRVTRIVAEFGIAGERL